MSRLALTPVNHPALASAPTIPTLKAGDSYYNTSNSTFQIYNGTSWVSYANITVIDGGTP